MAVLLQLAGVAAAHGAQTWRRISSASSRCVVLSGLDFDHLRCGLRKGGRKNAGEVNPGTRRMQHRRATGTLNDTLSAACALHEWRAARREQWWPSVHVAIVWQHTHPRRAWSRRGAAHCKRRVLRLLDGSQVFTCTLSKATPYLQPPPLPCTFREHDKLLNAQCYSRQGTRMANCLFPLFLPCKNMSQQCCDSTRSTSRPGGACKVVLQLKARQPCCPVHHRLEVHSLPLCAAHCVAVGGQREGLQRIASPKHCPLQVRNLHTRQHRQSHLNSGISHNTMYTM